MRLSRDATCVYAAALVRSLSVGFVGVTLAIYLSQRGLSVAHVGVIIGTGIAGGALATLLLSFHGDRFGRRRMLSVLAVLSAGGYVAAAGSTSFAVLLPLAFAGMLNGMGRDRGAAVALEQALLPGVTPTHLRTFVFAGYNIIQDAGLAVGALLAALPATVATSTGTDLVAAHRWGVGLCGLLTLASVLLYQSLSAQVEAPSVESSEPSATAVGPQTKRVVRGLASLFALDSFGSGFLSSSLVAYWFFQRYGVSEQYVAVLFSAARVLNAASHLGAVWIARRIGLLNTMVVTHLPSSVFLMLVPMAGSGSIAAMLFLAREALVEMDVPTRQSYVMAIVHPRERTYASGITNVTRNAAWAVAPSVAGIVMQQVALAAPLFIGGALKITYDLLLFRSFRQVRPAGEDALAVNSRQ